MMNMPFVSGIRAKDQVVIFRQLSAMLATGLGIDQALNLIIRFSNRRAVKTLVESLLQRVRGGSPLNRAMAATEAFPPVAVALVAAGEENGTLSAVCLRLADYVENRQAIRAKTINAAIYPAAVLTISLLAVYVLITLVVPRFAQSYGQMGLQLPLVTRVIFEAGKWLQAHWIWPPLLLALLWGSWRLALGFPAVKGWRDRVLLSVPLFGILVRKSITARCARTLASLFGSGVPVLLCLRMTQGVSGNRVAEAEIDHVIESVSRGGYMGTYFQESRVFDPLMGCMILVGEETGHVDEMLDKVADWAETELDNAVRRLGALLEPLLVVVVAGIVALVASAIYMPVILLIQRFSA
jgi:type IV pilus assembly protein PilC